MNVRELKRFCRGLPGTVEVDSGEPYNWLVHSVRGRKFAYFKTSEPERWRFSVRASPDRFVELTDDSPHASLTVVQGEASRTRVVVAVLAA